jgi:hypothetical protein
LMMLRRNSNREARSSRGPRLKRKQESAQPPLDRAPGHLTRSCDWLRVERNKPVVDLRDKTDSSRGEGEIDSQGQYSWRLVNQIDETSQSSLYRTCKVDESIS